ncbi:phenylalanine--tRNA ligase alpha subunit [Clostridia bacterium]|nr:phenylalanine--tRNA ligase alpha subunit [Clostridia bacterium]
MLNAKLKEIQTSLEEKISHITGLSQLEQIRIFYLGKKGELTLLRKQIKDVLEEERPKAGQMINDVCKKVEHYLEEKKLFLLNKEREERLKNEILDVTLPAKRKQLGHQHPNQKILEEVEQFFLSIGYEIIEGPEVEYDYYNFEALNIPADHPAKDEQDTFYISDQIVLRTQTSPVQIRTMEKGRLPIRMIAPGRVFRSDEVDATHSPSFHQIEGLVVDKGITFADLKGTLIAFSQMLFGSDTQVKFRPHHFQFTEPSAEVDVSCFRCKGKGCKLCKGSGWIEILGCGMVHPNVLRACHIDPDEYSGFAFGVGLERIALLKYEIEDMRLFYENDMRFLKQF